MKGIRFESDMSMAQHRNFNKLLNQLVTERANAPPEVRVKYSHQKEIDYFFDEKTPGTGKGVHLRVTRDANTLNIKPDGVVAKKRIADLNVHSPMRPFDYRISISTETPMPPPSDSSEPVFIREKDRLSYSDQTVQVDLTQVTLPSKPQEPVHELEVEYRDASSLLHLAYQARSNAEASQDWTAYDDQVLVLLNNIRLLMRFVERHTLTLTPGTHRASSRTVDNNAARLM